MHGFPDDKHLCGHATLPTDMPGDDRAILGDEGNPSRRGLWRKASPSPPALAGAVRLEIGDLPERCVAAAGAWMDAPVADTEPMRWTFESAAAQAAVAAFDRVTVAPGLRPVGVHNSDGCNGTGTMFGWPASDPLPDRPVRPRRDKNLAPPGATPLEQTLVCDRSPAGWLQLAVALTHLREFGSRWHGGRFTKHRLLDGDPDVAGTPGWAQWQVSDPDWRWLLRPAAFEPVVGTAPSGATAARFLSWCNYILDAGIWRYEWTCDGSEITWCRVQLARTSSIYMV